MAQSQSVRHLDRKTAKPTKRLNDIMISLTQEDCLSENEAEDRDHLLWMLEHYADGLATVEQLLRSTNDIQISHPQGSWLHDMTKRISHSMGSRPLWH